MLSSLADQVKNSLQTVIEGTGGAAALPREVIQAAIGKAEKEQNK